MHGPDRRDTKRSPSRDRVGQIGNRDVPERPRMFIQQMSPGCGAGRGTNCGRTICSDMYASPNSNVQAVAASDGTGCLDHISFE